MHDEEAMSARFYKCGVAMVRSVPALILLGMMATLASFGVTLASSLPPEVPTLELVRNRGLVICGVDGHIAGFSLLDKEGVMSGLDADSCRAVAAAVLGDSKKVQFVPVTATDRFLMLQTGKIDLLARNTTWTLTREASLDLIFAGITLYDGTGFMVRVSAGILSARDLDGATICMGIGTTTELAVPEFFHANGMSFHPVMFSDVSSVQQAFLLGRCDAYSSDQSQLAGFKYQQGTHGISFCLLPELISKEPTGVMVRKGDDQWLSVVRWTLISQIAGEQLHLTSANVDDMLQSKNSEVLRLLGEIQDYGQALGIEKRWAYNIIKQVGNYGEVFERNIAPLGLPRGLNSLWANGGLQYAPTLH